MALAKHPHGFPMPHEAAETKSTRIGKDNGDGPNSTSAIPRMDGIGKTLEEARLTLANTIAAIRGAVPGDPLKKDVPCRSLETSIGEVENLALEVRDMAQEIRDRIGECA
jgi:hypothetical protein